MEIDGYAYPTSRVAFERDHARDVELQIPGCRVIRVTWRRLVEQSAAVAVALARAA